MGEFELEPGEAVTRAVRKHWFVLLVQLIPFVVFALLPLLLPGWIAGLLEGSPTAKLLGVVSLANPWIRLALGLWWLLVWIMAFNLFTSYYLNQWIITTHRIIEINQRGFFSREVSSVLLNRIQDVSSDVQGLFATLLNYGTLTVQSAGTNDYFRMHDIDHPAELRDLVMREIADLSDDGLANQSNRA